jgi:hypothetical protein
LQAQLQRSDAIGTNAGQFLDHDFIASFKESGGKTFTFNIGSQNQTVRLWSLFWLHAKLPKNLGGFMGFEPFQEMF